MSKKYDFKIDENDKDLRSILLKPVSWRKSVILLLGFPITLAIADYQTVALLTGLPIIAAAVYLNISEN